MLVLSRKIWISQVRPVKENKIYYNYLIQYDLGETPENNSDDDNGR